MKHSQPVICVRHFALPVLFLALPLLTGTLPALAQGGGFGGGSGNLGGSLGGGGFGGGEGSIGEGGLGPGELSESEPRSIRSPDVLNDPRFAPLRKLIDIDLKSVSLRDAAQALAKATGVTVDVDNNIPADGRITIHASRVPLADVLTAIAAQTYVAIDPVSEMVGRVGRAGVLLRSWPSLGVSNSSDPSLQTYQSRNAPWSDKWKAQVTTDGSRTILDGTGHMITIPPDKDFVMAANGTIVLYPKGGGYGTVVGKGVGETIAPRESKPSYAVAPNGDVIEVPYGYHPIYANNGDIYVSDIHDSTVPAPAKIVRRGSGLKRGGSIGSQGEAGGNIAPLGNSMIAVAELGVGPKGEPGLTLTAYRFENGAFKKVGSTFHRFGSAPALRKTGQLTPQKVRELEVRGPKVAVGSAEPLTPAQAWARAIEKRRSDFKLGDVFYETGADGILNVVYHLHFPDGTSQYVREPADRGLRRAGTVPTNSGK